jgi:hypothetical protein
MNFGKRYMIMFTRLAARNLTQEILLYMCTIVEIRRLTLRKPTTC